MDTTQYQIILNKIKGFSTIILLQHQNPDGDALGSSWGLGHFIKHHYPQKKVLGWVSEVPDYLKFLQPLPQAQNSDFKDALVIISDTANSDRIDSSNWNRGKFIIKIDHHLNSENYGHLNLNCSDRIANAEIIGELLLFSELRIPPLSAQAIYTGIVSDSNRFLYSRTSADTLLLASKFLRSVPDLQLIYDQIYHLSYDRFQLKLSLARHFKISSAGLGLITLTTDQLQNLGVTPEIAKNQIIFFAPIAEVKVMLMVVENKKKHEIKFSIRSRKIDVLSICQAYSGGGHRFAAAGYLSTWSELKTLINQLERLILK